MRLIYTEKGQKVMAEFMREARSTKHEKYIDEFLTEVKAERQLMFEAAGLSRESTNKSLRMLQPIQE